VRQGNENGWPLYGQDNDKNRRSFELVRPAEMFACYLFMTSSLPIRYKFVWP